MTEYSKEDLCMIMDSCNLDCENCAYNYRTREELEDKKLCLGDQTKFKNALDEILEENKEGLERLGKS